MDIAHAPIHPGEILREDFLLPLGISESHLARTIGETSTRIGEVIRGDCGISPDMALRLSRALGTSDRFWCDLQTGYDLAIAREANAAELDRIESLLAS